MQENRSNDARQEQQKYPLMLVQESKQANLNSSHRQSCLMLDPGSTNAYNKAARCRITRSPNAIADPGETCPEKLQGNICRSFSQVLIFETCREGRRRALQMRRATTIGSQEDQSLMKHLQRQLHGSNLLTPQRMEIIHIFSQWAVSTIIAAFSTFVYFTSLIGHRTDPRDLLSSFCFSHSCFVWSERCWVDPAHIDRRFGCGSGAGFGKLVKSEVSECRSPPASSGDGEFSVTLADAVFNTTLSSPNDVFPPQRSPLARNFEVNKNLIPGLLLINP